MPRYYYGTVPALAWILNHYFYGGVHYNWLAAEFNPMRTNPNSSNPYVIYGQLYAAWSWPDERDKLVVQFRNTLQAGVDAHEERQTLSAALAERLRSICSNTSVAFFYPVVYRVDLERILPARRGIAGSGEDGSSEFLVRDLGELATTMRTRISSASFLTQTRGRHEVQSTRCSPRLKGE
jgi:hypothetical protein